MYRRSLLFFAPLFAALALGPALAHLLELPNKLGLERDAYFTVQQIYRGWALLGVVVFAALATSFALACSLYRQGQAFTLSLLGFLSLCLTQAIFWSFTFPANRDTENWTVQPPDWQSLRLQWEWSHAASALLNLLAVILLLLALLARRRDATP